MKNFYLKHWTVRASLALVLGFSGLAAAQGTNQGVQKFDAAAFPGFVVDEVVVPVPSEIFAVLDKLGDPNWKSEVRSLKNPSTTNRVDLSLAFGVVIAEGFVAVQAEDKQAVEKIGREVINLATSLGLTKAVRPHAQSILEAVDRGDWKGVRKEFDQTQNTVRNEMQRMRDNDLAQCVSLGGWLRGTASVTSVINKSYSQDRAELLNQPLLVEHFVASIDRMSKTAKGNRLVTSIAKGLKSIQSDMESSNGNFSEKRVKSISQTSEQLLASIQESKS